MEEEKENRKDEKDSKDLKINIRDDKLFPPETQEITMMTNCDDGKPDSPKA